MTAAVALSSLFIFALGTLGLLKHATVLDTGRFRPGFFCFYTNLSNILVLVYELALGVAALAGGALYRFLSGGEVWLSMVLVIFVTHIVYHFVLLPLARKAGKSLADIGGGSFGNLCAHYITPWLVLAQWLCLADKSRLGVLSAVKWIVLPLLYFAFAMLRARSGKPIGHTKQLYPYPFLDYPALGAKRFWTYVLAIVGAFAVLGLLLVGLARLIA